MFQLYNDDCLNLMSQIPNETIDMILCDLPYSRTQNKWDIIIPFDKLWKQYNRIIKDNGCIALFADGLFMADLMNSNRKMWKYNLVWNKVLTSGFLNANRMPLRQTEEICIFYKKQPTYNPQKTKGKPNHSKGKPKQTENNNYGNFEFVDNKEELGDMKHPTSLLTFSKTHPSKMLHPTQKPVELLEWLIKTYTNEGYVVLDNCMGSGSTGVACVNTNRVFIGIELDKTYFEIAKKRIENDLEFSTKYNNYTDDLPMEDYYKWQREFLEKSLKISNQIFYNIQMITGNKVALFKLLGDFSDKIKEVIIWDKINSQPAMMKGTLNSQFEFIFVITNNKPYNRMFDVCNFDRGNETNVWSIKRERNKFIKAGFPTELIKRIINNFTNEGDTILDPFMGSGTTGVVCKELNRNFIGIEIDKQYYDIAKERIENGMC